MKKIIVVFWALLVTTFIGIITVKAECGYAERNNYRSQANNMKFKYEIAEKTLEGNVDGEEVPVTQTYMKIYIYNLTEDLKLTVKDPEIKKTWNYTYDDVKDGVIIFDSEDVSRVINYEFDVYAADETCDTDELRISTLRVPKFNTYYYWEMCEETPEFYLCQKFIETDKTYEEFVSERDDYLKKLNNSAEETVEDESFFENLRDFIVKYKYVIILIAIITGVGVFVIVKKKRSRIV